MSDSRHSSRREFLKRTATSAIGAGLAPAILTSDTSAQMLSRPERPTFSPNDRVNIATIGMGIIGFVDTRTALEVPGVELVAAADLYDGRLARVEEVFGSGVDTTKDYRQIIDRSDVDAVLICTPDHWHDRITIEALEAGKAVYCEKPMVQEIDEGHEVVRVQQQTDGILQIGSQHGSSLLNKKAGELLREGAIGVLNTVHGRDNRNSAIGAWNYSIPPDASPETIDWERFIGDAPDRAFDLDRFFRWRKYWDYGTGIPGDLFVHRFTGLHTATGSMGPEHIFATGGIRTWTDGREVPDVMTGIFEYPETRNHPGFTFTLEVNMAAGGGGGPDLTFIGDEGIMEVAGSEVAVTRNLRSEPSLEALVDGYNSVRTFGKAQREAFIEQYQKYQNAAPYRRESPFESSTTFRAPEGYSSHLDHFEHFFAAIRHDEPVFEDAEFGLRTAAPSLLCNRSYEERQAFTWDPEAMELIA